MKNTLQENINTLGPKEEKMSKFEGNSNKSPPNICSPPPLIAPFQCTCGVT